MVSTTHRASLGQSLWQLFITLSRWFGEWSASDADSCVRSVVYVFFLARDSTCAPTLLRSCLFVVLGAR